MFVWFQIMCVSVTSKTNPKKKSYKTDTHTDNIRYPNIIILFTQSDDKFQTWFIMYLEICEVFIL